ncbi:hypothetical protein [Bizionia paragorgiae]|uniref:Uncharacterized protein n=1 Tax=Bizionia paragorgiae TaxID=283786 RepID=A0A1H3YMQ3_BIZPA|nr:hypothetical protein [Bizionia paragorgiae]SEA12899.1 hypothetical protein SAMN04487990_10710 [Bizionia paragorgiae]
MREYEQLKSHLSKNERNFVDVLDYDTQQYIDKGLYKSVLEKKHNGLENYLTKLVSSGERNLQFYQRRSNGSGSQLAGPVLQMTLKPQQPEEPIQQPMYNQSQPQALHGAQQGLPTNTSAAEMFLREKLVDVRERYTEKIKDLNERIEELKTDLDEYKSTCKSFRNKNDDLQSQVNLFEREKAMLTRQFEFEKQVALKEAESNQKGILDSETGQLLLTEGLGFVSQLAMKQQATTPGLNAPQQPQASSQIKLALLGVVNQEAFNDGLCETVLNTIAGLTQNEEFKTDLDKLLQQYELKPQ